MIALGGLVALVVPFLPSILAALAGLGVAINGVPQIAQDHPTAAVLGTTLGGLLLHHLPSPLAKPAAPKS